MSAKEFINLNENKRYFFIIILSLFFISSCSTVHRKEIFPLKKGNYWIIKTTRYHENGDFSSSKIDTTYVINDTTIKNQKYYLLADNHNKSNKKYFTNTDLGLFSYSGNFMPPELILKYPGMIGDKFKNVSMDTMRIDSINEEFEIGLGKFSCYKYTITGKGISNPYFGEDILTQENIYMCPGIGWIYYCSLDIYKDKIIKEEDRELIEFSVK